MSMNNNIHFPAEDAACLAMKPAKTFKVNGVSGKLFLANIVISALLGLSIHILFGVALFFLVQLITTIMFHRETDCLMLNGNITRVTPMLNR